MMQIFAFMAQQGASAKTKDIISSIIIKLNAKFHVQEITFFNVP